METQTNKELFSSRLAKALEEQWKVDVRLKEGESCDGSAIFSHKLILGSRSDAFKKILESDEVIEVTLSDVKQEELEALVEFMYSDGSMLSAKVKQHARSLYVVADKYEILHLRDLCRDELVSSLDLSNALELLELAQNPFDKALNNAALDYIKKNISRIVSSDEFKLFVATNPNLAVEIMSASLSRASINEDCDRIPSETRIDDDRVEVEVNVDEEVVVHVNDDVNVGVGEEVVNLYDDEVVAQRKSTRPRKPNRKYFGPDWV